MCIMNSLKPTEFETNQQYVEFSNRFSEISPIPSSEKKNKTDDIKVAYDILPVKELNFDNEKQRKKNIAKNFNNLEKFDKNSILFANNYDSVFGHEHDSLFDFNASGSSIGHEKDIFVKKNKSNKFYNEKSEENIIINAPNDLDYFESDKHNKREIIEMVNLERDLSQNMSSIDSIEIKNQNNKFEINEILNDMNVPIVDAKIIQNRSYEISLKASLESINWFEGTEEHVNNEDDKSSPDKNTLEDRISHNIMILENVA